MPAILIVIEYHPVVQTKAANINSGIYLSAILNIDSLKTICNTLCHHALFLLVQKRFSIDQVETYSTIFSYVWWTKVSVRKPFGNKMTGAT